MGWSKDHGTAAKVNAEYAKEQGNVAKQEATNLAELKSSVEVATQNASTAADNANAVIEDANTAASNADSAASEAIAQANHAKNEGDRAKAEADRLAGTDVSKLDNKITEVTTQLAQKVDKVIHAINPPAPLIAAKVDGVTDDSAAINAMFNFNKNIVVELPPNKVLRISNTIELKEGQILKGVSDSWITGTTKILMDNPDTTKPIIYVIQKSSTGIQNLELNTVQPRDHAIKRINTSRFVDQNLYINGAFKYAYYHEYDDTNKPTGGFYNIIRRVQTSQRGTKAGSKGFYFKSYFSGTIIERCDAHSYETGFHFDHTNAVHLDNPAAEHNDLGIYVGGNSEGLKITAPYFEDNLMDIDVHENAKNVVAEHMRYLLHNRYKHHNNLNIDGGLSSYHQAHSFKNLIGDGVGRYHDTNDLLTTWYPEGSAGGRISPKVERTNTGGNSSAIRFEAVNTSLLERGATRIRTKINASNKNVYMTVSGEYFVPETNVGQSAIWIANIANQSAIGSPFYFDEKGKWVKFKFVINTNNITYDLKLLVSPSFNKDRYGATPSLPNVGDYVLLSNVVVNLGFMTAIKDDEQELNYYNNNGTYTRHGKLSRVSGVITIPKDALNANIPYPENVSFVQPFSMQITPSNNFIPARIVQNSNRTSATIAVQTAATMDLQYNYVIEGYSLT